MSQYPAEPKVQAASVTAAVSGAVLYLLQRYVFKGAVPDGIASLVYVAVPGVLAYAAGWLAPHQVRQPLTFTRPLVPEPPAADPGNVTLKPPAGLT